MVLGMSQEVEILRVEGLALLGRLQRRMLGLGEGTGGRRWKAWLCLVVLSKSRRGNQEREQSYGPTKMGIDSSQRGLLLAMTMMHVGRLP